MIKLDIQRFATEPYIKFKDLPNTTTPLSSSNLNSIQTQIKDEMSTVSETLMSEIGNLTPVVLYNDTTGTTGTVTLSDSANNYTYLDIFLYKENCNNSQRIYNPNGKTFSLQGVNIANENTIQLLYKKITINEKSITADAGYYLNFDGYGASTSMNKTEEDSMFIYRVVGYK